MRRMFLLLLPFAAVALFFAALWRSAPMELASPGAESPVELPLASAASQPPTQAAAGTAQPRSVSSLRGTEVDGRLHVDAQGNLIISEDLRRLFDYFLSTQGEEPLSASIARLEQHLAANLQQPALAQALNLLNSYLAYKAALAHLEQDFPRQNSLQALREREQRLQQLRSQWFSREQQQALFGLEQLYQDFTLARLSLLHDNSLDADAKAAAVEQLRLQQPEELQALLNVQLHQDLRRQSQALQAQGGDSRALRALRMEMVGPQATARLEALDQRRAQWQARLQAYQAARLKIEQNQGLSLADQQVQITQLEEQHFDANERQRLQAALSLQQARQAN